MYSSHQQSFPNSNHSYYGPSSSIASTANVNTDTTKQHVWNGHAWVPTTSTTATTTDGRVEKFTRLYHAYTRQQQQQNPEQAAWSKYHAECAAYAAHYYHEHPTATELPAGHVEPPDIDTTTSSTTNTTRTTRGNRWDHGLEDTHASNSSQNSYYGPSSSSSKKQRREVEDTQDPSYYGPTSTLTTTPFVPTTQKKKTKKSKIASHSVLTTSSSTAKKIVSQKKSWSRKQQNGFDRSQSVLQNRQARFGTTTATSPKKTSSYTGLHYGGGDTAEFATAQPVQGTCTTLAKSYLRLTAPPQPEHVRPLPILRAHFQNLQERCSSDDYLWMCSQLKAIRQDCTVQHIRNAFTVQVYEFHARLALAQQDLNEFNQCQTQLMDLYPIVGDAANQNHTEFLAYRLLYHVVQQAKPLVLLNVWRDICALQKGAACPILQHALLLRAAYATNNMPRWWHLYRTAPRPELRHLCQSCLPHLRQVTLQRIVQAYRPTLVSVAWVCRQLGMEDDEDEATWRAWLVGQGCVLEGNMVVTKESKVVE